MALLALPGSAFAQSFTLDDNPAAPAIGAPGSIPGCGPEDQYKLAGAFCPPGLAPSPSLTTLAPPLGSGSVLAPGPAVLLAGPNGDYIDALSSNHATPAGDEFVLAFSVDRLSAGAAGSDVAAQATLHQQPADLFRSTRRFLHPAGFAGTLGAGPFAGTLAAVAGGAASNRLAIDDSHLGLVSGSGGVVPPGGAATPIAAGSHDNLDAWDDANLDANSDSLFDVHSYFSINPDEAAAVGASAADLFEVAAGTASTSPTPYAGAASMGLDSAGAGSDSIDALVVFDNGGLGGAGTGGPGVEPGTDHALFSLAPGSSSLGLFGLSAADVFFTDFSGAFALYASAADLGLVGVAGGAPTTEDNVDALELRPPPLPVPALPVPGLLGLALSLAAAAAWRLSAARTAGRRAPAG